MNAVMTQEIAGISKIKQAAKNHHIGLAAYAKKRLPIAEQAAKNSHTESMVSWWRNYAKKLRLIIKVAS